MTTTKLNKFFVYGTLMSGMGNHYLFGVNDIVGVKKGVVVGFNMHSMGSFPMCVQAFSDNPMIHGEVIEVKPEKLDEVLKRIDRLEGYNEDTHTGHYLRTAVQVSEYTSRTAPDTLVTYHTEAKVLAWMYIGTQKQVTNYTKVAHGDWRKHYTSPQLALVGGK